MQGILSPLHHTLVAGQPEIVVGAEHDPLGALHLHNGHRRRGEDMEVGQHVGLARGAQKLLALVATDLGKDVCRSGHIGSGPVSVSERTATVQVTPVSGRGDLKAFIDLPFRVHANHPLWVPLPKLERWLFLNRRLNAFFSHGEAEYFLARRDGRVVGRISAQVNHAFDDYQKKNWGWFGFLEFEDDQEVLQALLAAAESWLRAKGMERMVG